MIYFTMNCNSSSFLKIIIFIILFFHRGSCLSRPSKKILQKLTPPPHYGICPAPQYSLEQCAAMTFLPSTCIEDGECDFTKKCCSNGCVTNCEIPQSPESKPGTCPDTSMYPGPEEGCIYICLDDSSCTGSKKCCPTACGGNGCMEPALIKNGTCPIPPYTTIICPYLKFRECNDDSNCYGDMKCCYNGCGQSCLEPIKVDKNGTCPKVSFTKEQCACKKFKTCVEDLDCEGNLKCCFNGCSKTCTAPEVGTCVDPFLTPSDCFSHELKIKCINDTNCPTNTQCCDTGCGKTCLTAKDVKSGGCPLPFLNQTECDQQLFQYQSCDNDTNCPGILKCCNNGCGLACLVPLISKPGLCESYNSDIQCLINTCNYDWDCPFNKLCCDNGCICADPNFN